MGFFGSVYEEEEEVRMEDFKKERGEEREERKSSLPFVLPRNLEKAGWIWRSYAVLCCLNR